MKKLLSYIVKLLIVFGCANLSRSAYAQTLPVGMFELEEYYRREQLLGRLDSTLSFSVRPLSTEVLGRQNIFDPEGLQPVDRSRYSFAGGDGSFQLLPVSWQNQYTSSYPYGWNDGPMIPVPGYQTMLSAGVQANYKFLSVQFRPEFVYAQNSDYMGFNGETAASWEVWYRWANNIDMPEHFGSGSYTQAYLGQSSIRLNFDPISIGMSTENLWWGPGRRNSLLMSNTAPGFVHGTFNTTRPIRTPIGSIEGQFVAGRLLGSGFPPTALGNPEHYDQFYEPMRGDARYFSGVVLTYQPKWIPGLSLGLTRSFVRYHNDGPRTLNNYFPLLGSGSDYKDLSNPDRPATAEEEMQRDNYGSVFFRWMLPKGKSEFYFEYGRNDQPWNARDLMVQLEHSRAYVMGFTKLVDLHKPQGDLLEFNIELTQLETSRSSELRTSPSWYVHPIVRHGYTHRGQVLGAGVGPGSNVQSTSFSWVRGLKRLSLQLERLVHNNDFYYAASGDIRKNWVELGGGLQGVWDYQSFIFSGGLQFMHSYNYQYEIRDAVETRDNFWNFTRYDRNNLQLKLGVMYRF